MGHQFSVFLTPDDETAISQALTLAYGARFYAFFDLESPLQEIPSLAATTPQLPFGLKYISSGPLDPQVASMTFKAFSTLDGEFVEYARWRMFNGDWLSGRFYAYGRSQLVAHSHLWTPERIDQFGRWNRRLFQFIKARLTRHEDAYVGEDFLSKYRRTLPHPRLG